MYTKTKIYNNNTHTGILFFPLHLSRSSIWDQSANYPNCLSSRGSLACWSLFQLFSGSILFYFIFCFCMKCKQSGCWKNWLSLHLYSPVELWTHWMRKSYQLCFNTPYNTTVDQVHLAPRILSTVFATKVLAVAFSLFWAVLVLQYDLISKPFRNGRTSNLNCTYVCSWRVTGSIMTGSLSFMPYCPPKTNQITRHL